MQRKLIPVPEIAQMLCVNKDTVLRYFRHGVLHVYEISREDGRSLLSEEFSIQVRIGVLHRLRAERRMTLARIGTALSNACGDGDRVTKELQRSGKSIDEARDTLMEMVVFPRQAA